MVCFMLTQSAEKAYYRYVVLLFNCLLSFGSYFCMDIPSVLQDQFQGNLTCPNATATNETVECVLGLGMSPQQYNSLSTIYSWTTAALLMMSGLFIDTFGNSLGICVFSLLCVLGSALFALGSHFQGTPVLLPLMLVGRLFFGLGCESLDVVQDRITAFWFKGKELSLAFGLTLGFSRLGSVLNFFITMRFEEKYGLQWTLWGGTLLCVFGIIIAIIVSILDKIGTRHLENGTIQVESRKKYIQDLKLFPLRYWLLCLYIMFFYNIIFPFLANATEFFKDKYTSYSLKEAAYIAGAIYDCSLVLTIIFGWFIDYVGMRGIFLVACSVLALLAFGLLAFTYVPPLVSTIILGFAYSCASVCMWTSISLVVPQTTLGTAIGLVVSIMKTGNGVCNLIIGWILGPTSRIPLWRWQRMMIFMMANTVCSIVTSVLLNIVDGKQGGTLNKTTKRSE
ncbi:lysosomal dipeptide transporter MFSD1-like [Nelusetta ayraudi]|uniref:lysosomal dipeptide transporter MFSD1-like n=1 Tax=Nelusetta ayraudi TaxID=303726 RepID=UPI003F6E9D2F